LVLASLSAWISAWGQSHFVPALYAEPGWDLYFQADTFTYAAHFTPALEALAAGAYFAPSRKIWLVAAALLVVLNGYGNLSRFVEASAAVNATLGARR
jgi:hypothetical protein